MTRQPESYVVSAAVELAALRKWKARKFRESPFGVKGCPDLLLTSPTGVHVWAEAKRPETTRSKRGRVRPAQREFLLDERSRCVPSCVFDEALDLEPVFASRTIEEARAAADVLLLRFVPEAGWLVPDSTLAGETPGPTEGERPSDGGSWR